MILNAGLPTLAAPGRARDAQLQLWELADPQYTHDRMRAAFETVARAAKGHGKAIGGGGARQDFEFQSWLLRLGVPYLTGGFDVGYIPSSGRRRR